MVVDGPFRRQLERAAPESWVLWVVEVGDPRRSKTEVLEAVFLDDVTFVLVLGSRCFWAKVTDEPAIRSACLMVRTRFEGPLVRDPPHGFLQTVPSAQKKGLGAGSQSSSGGHCDEATASSTRPQSLQTPRKLVLLELWPASPGEV